VERSLSGAPRRSTSAAFVEFNLPVVSAAMKIPLLRNVSVQAGTRVDAYSDLGALTHSQFSLTWEPVAHVALRGTYGTSYRPPSLFDLQQPIIRVPSVVADLRRNNQISSITVTAGGNPDLKSTTAQSWSAGLAWTPPGSSDLNLSATWWHTQLKERLTPVVLQVLLDNEELFPERVMRGAPSANDIAAGLPGTLTASGIDAALSAGLQTRLGRLISKLSTTWMDEFAVTDMPGLAVEERVG